jgi:hypothetical protein
VTASGWTTVWRNFQAIRQVGSDTVIEFGGGNSIRLEDVWARSLDSHDFLLS